MAKKIEVQEEVQVAPVVGVSPLAIDLGRADLNEVVAKLNEVIRKINE